MSNARRDDNFVPTLIGVSSVDLSTPVTVAVNPVTHRVLTDNTGNLSTLLKTDVFTSSNNQTIFTATSGTPVYTLYLSINGSIQTPNVDYTVASTVATLTNGIPSGSIVVWLYSTS